MQKTRYGYSTVEILVVLAVILLLAGITGSIVFASKEAIHTKSCAVNVRQLSNALSIYAQDYDGTYPAFSTGSFRSLRSKPHLLVSFKGTSWSESLLPYLSKNGSTFRRCPGVDENALPDDTRSYFMFSYAYNINVSESTVDIHQQTKAFEGNPDFKVNFESLTVVFTEARLGIIALGGPDEAELSELNAMYPRKLKQQISRQRIGATRHQGGANYAFADGHVKWFKPKELSVNKKCDGNTPGFGL